MVGYSLGKLEMEVLGYYGWEKRFLKKWVDVDRIAEA